MKAYVINLPRCFERRQHIEQQLAKARLEYEFVEAVDGLTLNREDWPDWLSLGAVGVCLSHLNAYRAILRDGAPGLVLEDDAVLPRELPDIDVPDGGVALLYYRAPTSLKRLPLAGEGPLLRPLAAVASAVAYIITPAACERMIDFSPPHRGIGADDWKAFPVTTWCVEGRPVGTRLAFKSSVGYASGRFIPAWLRTLNRWRIERRMSRFQRVA